MNSFKDFTKFIQNEFKNKIVNKDTRIAMYCTGGIRCEIASAYIAGQGYKNCQMLKGGILKYLENVDININDANTGTKDIIVKVEENENHNEINPEVVNNTNDNDSDNKKSSQSECTFKGECYVFDKRVSLGVGLQQGTFKICFRCRAPLSAKDQSDSKYIDGICCGHCIDSSDYKNLHATAERNKQIQLAEERGDKRHLRRDFFDNTE